MSGLIATWTRAHAPIPPALRGGFTTSTCPLSGLRSGICLSSVGWPGRWPLKTAVFREAWGHGVGDSWAELHKRGAQGFKRATPPPHRTRQTAHPAPGPRAERGALGGPAAARLENRWALTSQGHPWAAASSAFRRPLHASPRPCPILSWATLRVAVCSPAPPVPTRLSPRHPKFHALCHFTSQSYSQPVRRGHRNPATLEGAPSGLSVLPSLVRHLPGTLRSQHKESGDPRWGECDGREAGEDR